MRIIVAEDDELLRKSLAHFLGNNGYEIIQKEDGEQAIEELKKSKVDLLITDLNMPNMGGMEIISIVRNELGLDIPIIVLTSSGLEQSELDAFDIGASEFISKPFSPSVLKARIEKLLRNVKS